MYHCLFTALLSALSFLCAAPIPATLSASSGGSAPIWISAEAVRTAENGVRWDLFKSADRGALQRHAQTQRKSRAASGASTESAAGCSEYFAGYEITRTDAKPSATFDDLVQQSEGIYRGTVTAIQPGFFKGFPGALLRLNIDAAVRPSAAYQDQSALFLFHPYKTFAVGDALFCTGSTYEPRVGDRVLAFALYPPQDASSSVIFPENQEYLFEDSDGVLHVPPRWRNDPGVVQAETLLEMERRTRASPINR